MNYTPAGQPFARLPATLAVLLLLPAVPAHPAPPALETPASIAAAATSHLQGRIASEHPDLKAAIEVTPPDARLYLVRCSNLQFTLPAGNTLHGAGAIGLRCVSPQPWSLFLSYRIRLSGPAAVAARPLTARQPLSANDIAIREIEFSRAPAEYLRTPSQIQGLQTRQPVAAGQPLLLSQMIRPMAVRAGEKARLVAESAGFSISHECTALNTAAEGEGVRCKTPSGRIIQGTAQQGGVVRVSP